MRHLEAEVVVVGGGSTGVGVARDAAMRGFRTILLERADLGQGTTSRFHGLLHSGGRYVVSDLGSATECAQENAILRRIQPHAIEDTGGFFVVTPDDDPAFADDFLAGAAKTGVPATEIPVVEALRRERLLNPGIKRVIEVADGSVDGWALVWSAARSAQSHGAQVLTYHRATGIQVRDGRVVGISAHDVKNDEQVLIDCSFILNCAGPWAGQVAALAGCHDVNVIPGAGIMIAMNHRLVNTVINRCVYPTDGDILVPVHTVSIIGTTDVKADDPDKLTIPRDQVQQMMDAGSVLIPTFREHRAVHAWAGARPLIKDDRVSSSDTRHMSRGMAVLDHDTRDGIKGMLTIGGGKLTTYRLMAEHIVDAMCEQLGQTRECTTATEPVPGEADGKLYHVTHRLHEREKNRLDEQTICECELLARSQLVSAMKEQPLGTMDDWRRQTRLGMGPCQGGFCSTRAAGIAVAEEVVDHERATGLLRLFLANRWIGLWPILANDQVRQVALDHWMLDGTMSVGHLPALETEIKQ